jgi:hypothetical protein
MLYALGVRCRTHAIDAAPLECWTPFMADAPECADFAAGKVEFLAPVAEA